MVRVLLVVFLMAVLGSPFGVAMASPSQLSRPGRSIEHMQVEGLDRTYTLRIPPQYEGDRKLPLIIALHGWSTSGDLVEMYSGLGLAAEAKGFILACPDGMGNPRGWNAGFIDLSGVGADDLLFISRLIDRLARQLRVDRQRIYVVGHSNGAMMANLVGAKLGDRVAAIGVVAGTVGLPASDGKERALPYPQRPVSVMIIHGRKDPMVSYASNSNGILKGLGAYESAQWWAKQLRTGTKPERQTIDGGIATRWTWRNGRDGAEVTCIAVANGYHDWPGGWTRSGRERSSRFDATGTLLDFLWAHPKAGIAKSR